MNKLSGEIWSYHIPPRIGQLKHEEKSVVIICSSKKTKLPFLKFPCLEASVVKPYLKLFVSQSLLCLLFIILSLTASALPYRYEGKINITMDSVRQ